MVNARSAVLVLESGKVYKGCSIGRLGTVIGEVVFNTGMTGYQEVLTDPSYYGQIITFTYPELGNTGVNLSDTESKKLFARGLITKNLCKVPSNWRSEESLEKYLQSHNIICIYGLDTRSLTKYLRQFGSMNGAISTEIMDPQLLIQQIKLTGPMKGKDLVSQVTTQNVYLSNEKVANRWYFQSPVINLVQKVMCVVVIDFGVKTNILRRLHNFNCKTIVVPATTNIKTVLSYKPDGILLSNGPGDPSAVIYAVTTIKYLLRYSIPVFGICMGHQLLSIALGYGTYKLKFGHRGLNHPTGSYNKVYITSQNHSFAVSKKLQPEKYYLQTAHKNFNDSTIAGVSHTVLPFFSVQYHPEASPGPHDSDYLFAYFISSMYKYSLTK
uniref:Carbamoyl phosphate synthase small chain n=1 Tax=Hildenbrandia rivularis TaxID=135206 RepID=A0A1C9CFM2_9FLOR|nr:carbamoyl-phosphate synthase arginine-specific small subunit [Hildenbrandia rivularis]AOM67162.1 carbamoyl-phosphate synthase arginine-specific small subunit [Hildenbrandia rivularis]